jgi:hypothetical protein
MGHCYARVFSAKTGKFRNSLVCDKCSNPGASTRRCPAGYCPGSDICKTCWNGGERAADKKYHLDSKCHEKHAEFVAQEARKQEMLDAGKWLRCAALGVGNGPDRKVHVVFRNKTGAEKGLYMAAATYNALPLLSHATPEDYAAVGAVEPAPANFH